MKKLFKKIPHPHIYLVYPWSGMLKRAFAYCMFCGYCPISKNKEVVKGLADFFIWKIKKAIDEGAFDDISVWKNKPSTKK